ncbi:MAG TPA: hypothetical protein VMB84_12970 [Stellaceae bacterium]|nr:hypothetical protein [Stellaceae bacterium]
MYARIGRARIRPGAEDELKGFCAELARASPGATGPRYWMNFVTDDDELIVIGVYASAEERAASGPRNLARWRVGRHLLAEEPRFSYAELTQFVARRP